MNKKQIENIIDEFYKAYWDNPDKDRDRRRIPAKITDETKKVELWIRIY